MKTYKVFPQIVVALTAYGGTFIYGILLGWSSPSASSLLSDKNNFFVSTYHFGWIVALMAVGVATSSVPSGIIRSKIGTKLTVMIFGVFITVGWLLILFALSPAMIMTGRYLCGLAGGCYTYVLQIYVGEIASKEIRGKLLSMFNLTVNLGVLFTFIIGNYTSFLVLNIFCGSVPVLYTIAFQFLPESPVYLITKGKDSEAIQSFMILRGKSYDFQFEVQTIKKQHEALQAEKKSFSEVFKTKSTKKAFVIIMFLFLFFQSSGNIAILSYTSVIFVKAGIGIDTDISTITVAVVQVIASIVTFILVDRFGRKKLLCISSIFNCLSLIGIGSFFLLQELGKNVNNLGWLPITSLCIFVGSFGTGTAPVTFILLGELFIQDAKTYVAPIGLFLSSIMSALVGFTFPLLTEAIGSGPTFFMFSAFCAIALVFCLYFVPETKGKTTMEIQEILNKCD